MNQTFFLQSLHSMSLPSVLRQLDERSYFAHPIRYRKPDHPTLIPQRYTEQDKIDGAPGYNADVTVMWNGCLHRREILRKILDDGFLLLDPKFGGDSLGEQIRELDNEMDHFPKEFEWFIENWTKEMLARDRVQEVIAAVKRIHGGSLLHFYRGGLGTQINHTCMRHLASHDHLVLGLVKAGLLPYCNSDCVEKCWFEKLSNQETIESLAKLGFSKSERWAPDPPLFD